MQWAKVVYLVPDYIPAPYFNFYCFRILLPGQAGCQAFTIYISRVADLCLVRPSFYYNRLPGQQAEKENFSSTLRISI